MNPPSRHESNTEPNGSRAHLEELDRRDAGLAQTIEGLLGREDLDVRELAVLLAGRMSIANRRLTVLSHWVSRLTNRLGELESRSERLSRKAGDHEDSLLMICQVLKDLDDPYGFGLSLDERIAEDGPSRSSGEMEI